jgi:hypothetical protein
MVEDHRRELEHRLRKNHGRRLAAEWSRSLSAASGVEISASSFISVERTEELKRAFFAKVKSEDRAMKASWEKDERETLLAHLLDTCVDVRTLEVILFNCLDRFVGAVRVPADCVLRNAMAVWQVVKEDLSMMTEDLQHGLCLEENFYAPSGEYVREGLYELTAWGKFARNSGDRPTTP